MAITIPKLRPVDILWRLINVVVAALWIVVAVFYFMDGYFQIIMPGIFLVIVAVSSILFEFWRPTAVLENCYFMWNFMGRGIFYLLMGCVVLGFRTIQYVSAGFSWFFGLLYILLWFSSFTLYPVSTTTHSYV